SFLAPLCQDDLVTCRGQTYPHQRQESLIIVYHEDLFASHVLPQCKSSHFFLSYSISISRERSNCICRLRIVASLARNSASSSRERFSCVWRLRIVASLARNSVSSRRRFSSLVRFSVMRARQACPSKAQGVCGYFLSSSSKYCRALGRS